MAAFHLIDSLFQVARDIHFGDKECFSNSTTEDDNDTSKCSDIKEEEKCNCEENCFWSFSGMGYEYQVLKRYVFFCRLVVKCTLTSDCTSNYKVAEIKHNTCPPNG